MQNTEQKSLEDTTKKYIIPKSLEEIKRDKNEEAFKKRRQVWWLFLILYILESIGFVIYIGLMNSSIYASWISLANIWWYIPIQLIPILMLFIMRSNLSIKKSYDNTNNIEESLLVRGGSVRAFLIVSIICIIIPYAISRSGEPIPIPVPFLVAFSIILIYYEIKPEDILPKSFLVQIPDNYGTISRMPIISSVIDKAYDTIENIEKKIREIKENASFYLDEGENLFKTLKKVWDEKLDDLMNRINNLTIKSKNIFEQAGIILLLIFIAALNLSFIGLRTDPLDGLVIASASLLSVISIIFGINIQKIILNGVKKKVDNVFLEVSKALYITKNVLETGIVIEELVNGEKVEVVNLKDVNLDKIKVALEEVKKKNILTFFPKDIVAAITVNLMVLISGLLIMIPAFLVNQWVLLGIEFIIGYYFISKK